MVINKNSKKMLFVFIVFVFSGFASAASHTPDQLIAAVSEGGTVLYSGPLIKLPSTMRISRSVSIECSGPGPHWTCPDASPCIMSVQATSITLGATRITMAIRGCVISGFSTGHTCLKVVAVNVVLKNVTLQDCSSSEDGGAIYYSGGSVHLGSITMSGVIIRRSSTTRTGGCVHLRMAETLLTDCLLEDCDASTSSGSGAALTVISGIVRIVRTVFRRGTSNFFGGCVYLHSSVQTTIADSIFDRCSAGGRLGTGGAISAFTNPANIAIHEVYGCKFLHSKASTTGGCIGLAGGTWDISNSAFTDCTSTDIGGAIALVGVQVMIRGVTVNRSKSLGKAGGGVGALSGSVITLMGTTFTNCTNSSGLRSDVLLGGTSQLHTAETDVRTTVERKTEQPKKEVIEEATKTPVISSPEVFFNIPPPVPVIPNFLNSVTSYSLRPDTPPPFDTSYTVNPVSAVTPPPFHTSSANRLKSSDQILKRVQDQAKVGQESAKDSEDRFPRSPPILKFHYEELWQEDPESLRIRLRKSGVGCSSHQSSDDFISLQHDKVLSGLSGRHVLMIGDSMMRYQYLNLAYYLSSGKWRSQSPPNEEEAQHGSWAAFYAMTNARLKTEVCDCYRPTVLDFTKYLENRYFIDLSHNFRISYVQQLGSNLFSPHTLGYMNAYCTKEKGCVQKGCTAGQCVPSTHPIDHVGNGSSISGPAAWVTMACSLRPDTVVVNMGLWYILNDPTGYAQVVDASKQILACPGMQSTKFVWKTTTPRSVEIGNQNNPNVGDPVLVALLKDHKEWSVFDANGIVQQLKGYAAAQSHNMFWDPAHFRTPVYAGLNQVFLTQLLGNSVVDGGC